MANDQTRNETVGGQGGGTLPYTCRKQLYRDGEAWQVLDARGHVIVDCVSEDLARHIAVLPEMVQIIRDIASPGINHGASIELLARIDGKD